MFVWFGVSGLLTLESDCFLRWVPHDKAYSVLGSILGSPGFGKLPHLSSFLLNDTPTLLSAGDFLLSRVPYYDYLRRGTLLVEGCISTRSDEHVHFIGDVYASILNNQEQSSLEAPNPKPSTEHLVVLASPLLCRHKRATNSLALSGVRELLLLLVSVI